MRAVLYTLPAVVLFLAIPLSFEVGTPIPVSFMFFFAAIVLAAAGAGHLPGLVAGALCASATLYLHLRGIGPPPLTATPMSTAIGSTIFIATGHILGRLRSDRDDKTRRLEASQAELQLRLASQRAEHQKSLEALRISEARLGQAARIARLGYFVFNVKKGIVELCSDRHAAIFGMTPQEFMDKVSGLRGELELVHPDDRELMRAAYERLRSGQDIELDYRFFHRNGTMGFVREYVTPERGLDGSVVRGIGSSIDMTAEKQTEERLRQTQKLHAVGQLTAGVAHDFNNLLAVILGNAELMIDEGVTPEQKATLDQIVRASERGSSLTRSLLSFAQKSQLSPEIVDPNAVVTESARMYRRTLFDDITLETDLAPDAPSIELDRNLLENALLNLVINARDAMQGGGHLRLETEQIEILRDSPLAHQLGLLPGSYTRITVSDNGHGIAPETLGRVTEPFFTTKNRAEGSGLGLSMVQGFVRQSHGAMQIASEPGQGTSIRLYFPARNAPARTAPQAVPASPPALRAFVVEDDPAVRKILLSQLSRLNVTVTVASDGQEAIARFTEPGQFDVAILDNIMPGRTSGVDVAGHIRSIDDKIGIILQSGDTSAFAETEDLPFDIWLRKPVKMRELTEALGRLSNADAGRLRA